MSAADKLKAHPDILIGDLMSQPVLTVEVGETLWDAWQLLFVSGLRHLVVIDEDGTSLGVLSDRNILADVPLTAENLSRRKVRDMMARVPLVSVRPADLPMVAARIMAAHTVQAVPVLNDRGHLVGILTETDLVKWLAG